MPVTASASRFLPQVQLYAKDGGPQGRGDARARAPGDRPRGLRVDGNEKETGIHLMLFSAKEVSFSQLELSSQLFADA